MENNVGETGELKTGLTLMQFIKEFFTNFKNFLEKYLVAKKPPFLFIMMWLFGMSNIIDRLEMQGFQLLNNWIVIWAIILIGGIISGYLGYWIGGAFYHLRVLLSGGSKNYQISRNLFLYTGLPVYIVTVFSEIIDTFVYGNKYFTEPTHAVLDLTWFGLVVIGIIYSISLSYRGVCLLQKTKRVRSVIFFIILPAVFYLVFFSGIFFSAIEQYSDVLNYNERALEQMYAGNYDEAENLFNQALEKTTKEDKEEIIQIHANLGLLYRHKGQTDQAIENFQKALSFSGPDRPVYHSMLGKINILKGDTHEAISNFEQALKLNPDDFDGHNMMGLIFLGEIDTTITDYERALIHNEKAYSLGENIATMQNLAINYYFLGRYSDALPLLESINSISPNNDIAKYFIGLIYYVNGDLTKAKIFLREAINLNPTLINPDVERMLNE